ncbi:MAG TPA: hypothetical protein VK845_15715 [Gemmatimonadales bacterium]|nr:hypothetical protein [Gemmatimonadales bacterium]
MKPAFDLWMPRSRRWSPWAIGLSVAIHIAFILVFRAEGHLPHIARRPSPDIIVLSPPEAERREVLMPFGGAPAVPPAAGRPTVRTAIPAEIPEPDTVAYDFPPVTVTVTETSPYRRTIGRIAPSLAGGGLWVRPLPLPPQELAQRITRSHEELVDSAVTAIVQAFLDSVTPVPGSVVASLPKWTTEIGGKKFGIDGSNIYIAGLKIPTAVLALLPLQGGNIDQSRRYNDLMDMRSDIYNAARRADNLEEFKQVIEEIRERKEREKEFERNQRTAPPPEEPPVP